MDLQMPVLDGLAATSAIRSFEAEHGRSAVPIVAYSNSLPGAALLARHGLNGSLAKPCEDAELDDCLRRWCPDYRPLGVAENADMARRWLPTAMHAPQAVTRQG
jgi:CheY-like chemotaxis protein